MIDLDHEALVRFGPKSGRSTQRLFLFPQEKIKVKELTDEQKLSRAERSRLNGKKSKGPITNDGKYRSSMNAIATGEHVELHKEDLPPFFFLMTTDDRQAYIRSHQSHMRKFRPDSELELGLVRRIVCALFQYDRFTSLYAEALQRDLDQVLREYPSLTMGEQFLHGHIRTAKQKDFLRYIERGQKFQFAAYNGFIKTLQLVRKGFPVDPPEPVDISADNKEIDDPGPDPAAMAEILEMADRAKKEPTLILPLYVVNLLMDNDFMSRMAPNYDLGDLLDRYGLGGLPKAA